MEQTDKGNWGEEFVNQLAYKSFLKYWCYPGPQDEYGDRKEIVDLFILFKNICLLISVKNYEFKGKYDKYFRKTLTKATDQLYGAERKLFQSDRPIFIKHPDREAEQFQPASYAVVQRIIVNLGEQVQYYPFNTTTKGSKFVHVLDKIAFERIIGELDTLPDLVDYLEKREELFTAKKAFMLPGEEHDFDADTADQFLNRDPESDPMTVPELILSGSESDLVASFLRNDRKFHSAFKMEDYNGAYIQLDGEWDEFQEEKKVKVKKEQDTISYFIDKFVLNEVLPAGAADTHELAIELLSLNRFYRRVIAKSFWEFVSANKNNDRMHVARRYAVFENTAYLFLHFHEDADQEFVEVLSQLAMDAHLVYDQYKPQKLVLIASQGFMKKFHFGYAPEVKRYPKEYEEKIMEDCRILGWFTDIRIIHHTETEYLKNQP